MQRWFDLASSDENSELGFILETRWQSVKGRKQVPNHKKLTVSLQSIDLALNGPVLKRFLEYCRIKLFAGELLLSTDLKVAI